MKRSLVFVCIASVFGLEAHANPVCQRNVEVQALTGQRSETATWDVALFIQLFETVLSGGVNLPASPPDYVATGTFSTEGKGSALGLGIGFVGGRAPKHPSFAGSLNPVYFYGDRVFLAGLAKKNTTDPARYVGEIAAELAAEGGLVNLFRRYERIPTSAKAKLDVKCFDPGETRTIKLFELTSPYQLRRSSQVKDRLIVEADQGTIANGAKLRGGKGRVYTVSSSRKRGEELFVSYTAPEKDGVEQDTIRVHNSCEIRDPSVFPLGRTTKKSQILEFEVAICKKNRELEYNHRMTITYGGSNMKYTVKGSVPFQLKDREGNVIRSNQDRYNKDELNLDGKGTLPVTMKGRVGKCSMTYTSTMTATIKGKAKHEGRKWYLYPEIDENYAKKFTMTVKCDDDVMTRTMTLPAPPVKYPKNKLRFRDRDGTKISGPFKGAGGRGTYELILHVPERF